MTVLQKVAVKWDNSAVIPDHSLIRRLHGGGCSLAQLFSARNSLFNREKTGNFANLGLPACQAV